MTLTRSTAEARCLSLAAQGFGGPRKVNAPGWRDLGGVVKRLGLLQIDSVNVLVRAHYLPLFSRLALYDRADFDAKTYRRGAGALFEYWAREASLLPIEWHPLLRWRMARARNMEGIYKRLAEFARERRAFVEAVPVEVAARGPISASELRRRERRSNGWWSWDEGKLALEYLFWAGLVTTATRRGNFERVYDLTERVIPRTTRVAPTPTEADAMRALVQIAARALGVATAADQRDYFRLPLAETRRAGHARHRLMRRGSALPKWQKISAWQNDRRNRGGQS